ncbi:MAG: hypothetical protein PXZ08_00360 [Actinomycetota bacterium]|jgi:hypothetical protein|nr:hypothetical protein [Actinomycetota bacterium]
MLRRVLHDAVSLKHFAIANRLDVLEERHGHLAEPRWCEEVQEEIKNGIGLASENAAILSATWLGTPASIAIEDMAAAYKYHVVLNDGREPPTMHKGEAYSIFVGQKIGAIFFTDDGTAYEWGNAKVRSGLGGVKDTIDVLRDAVSMGELTKEQACELALTMQDRGRDFRSVHDGKFTPAYFDR